MSENLQKSAGIVIQVFSVTSTFIAKHNTQIKSHKWQKRNSYFCSNILHKNIPAMINNTDLIKGRKEDSRKTEANATLMC